MLEGLLRCQFFQTVAHEMGHQFGARHTPQKEHP
ncbi:MAG: hypothetical protein HUU01_15795 [Saprospiraceae bacterium]|nr:hypothetical protein [Saprospiraceae bacterium]